MAEKSTPKDNTEQPLNEENEVLKPPPRRKKSMKKSKIEAEKARQRQLDNSLVVSADNTKLTANYQDVKTENNPKAINEIPDRKINENCNIETQPHDTLVATLQSGDKQSNFEPNSTNKIQINDSKVEKQPGSSENSTMATEESLSIDENRGLASSQMGNKQPKSNLHNTPSVSTEKGTEISSNHSQSNHTNNEENNVTSNEIESFLWVENNSQTSSTSIDKNNSNFNENVSKQQNVTKSDTGKSVTEENTSSPMENIQILPTKENSNLLKKPSSVSDEASSSSCGENSSTDRQISSQLVSGNGKSNSQGNENTITGSDSAIFTTSEQHADIKDLSKESQSLTECQSLTKVDCMSESKRSGNTDSDTLSNIDHNSNSGGDKQEINPVDLNSNSQCKMDSESLNTEVDDWNEKSLCLQPNLLGSNEIHPTTKGETTIENSENSSPLSITDTKQQSSTTTSTMKDCINQEKSNLESDDNVELKTEDSSESKHQVSSEQTKESDQSSSNKLPTASPNKEKHSLSEKEENNKNTNTTVDSTSTGTEAQASEDSKTKSTTSSKYKGKHSPRKGDSFTYQHLGDSLSSVEEYELWEEENLSSDSDSDIFYSDYSSSGDEGEYNLELREKTCGTHKIDGSLGDSLPRSPTGENTINQILAVFPNTEYLSVTDSKVPGSHDDVNHDDSETIKANKENNNDRLELSDDRAASLKRKIGSFKVVPSTEPKADAEVTKAVAMPTKSRKQPSEAATNADEAEKAIQALHENYLKHMQRDIKPKPRKSVEKEGESAVYFSRVTSSEQDDSNDNAVPIREKNLEISRPRSIHGEPRLRSLSTGDLTNAHQFRTANKRFTLPARGRTASWKNENEERLVELDGELRFIIGSMGNLEKSRERRDSGTPMLKRVREGDIEKVVEEESDVSTKDAQSSVSKPEQKEESSDEVSQQSAVDNKVLDKEESENSDFIPRSLSVVREETAPIPESSTKSSASPEEQPKESNKNDIEGKEDVAAPLEGATPNKKSTLVRFKDEIDTPLSESTPKRPRSLDLSGVFSELDESSIDAFESDNSGLDTTNNTTTSSKSSVKNSAKNGEVEIRKIKMTKGRRPFSSIEPRNIPSSPTEENVKLRSFYSTSDADCVDTGDDSKADGDVSTDVEPAEEAKEETTPTRPPRRKPPLNHSASFFIPSREKPVKRTKNKNRTDKSFRQTLSDADWLKVRLSMAKPLPELAHDGPITLVTDALPASIPNFPTYKRAQIALELYTTERTYVRGLETVIELFKTPLEGYLDSKEMETMFSNINTIFTLNKDVLFSLCERVTHWKDDQMIGDIFTDMAPRFKIYSFYCTNYDAAETLIKQKIKRKKEFESFLNTCYNDPICQPGLTLQAYLITVVQRIPRYLLLLRDLGKCTPSDHVDHKTVKEGLQKMNNIAEYINNQLQAVQGQRAMTELRSRVIGIKAFETPGRSLIKEGEVYLMSTKKTYKCLLFNDMIVFAAKNVNKHSEVELTVELKTLWVCDLDHNDPQTRKEDALELYTPERSYTMYAGSRNEKKLWLQKLKTAIAIQLLGEEATESSEISSRKAAFTFKDGRIYCGYFVDSKTHGQGVLAWPNRTRYVGNFEDGERNGIGELTYCTGEKYEGEWVDDKQHGVGKLTYPNGDFYCGEWKQAKMHGKGMISFSNKDKIDGQFVDSEVCGTAKLECSNGLVYDGTWKNSKKHGKGKLTYPNGDFYEGEFQHDRIHGEGTMVYAKTKATYKGQWENNQRHGIGSYSIPNDWTYEGEWSADHIQGRGRMVYNNGEEYEGSWFRDMRFGKGLFKSHQGLYDGHFEYNLRHKYGVMEYNDGSQYEGEWQNDQREGQGLMIYADLGVYEGSWFHNLRHGRGKMTYPNGATFEGSWDLDSQHGTEGVYLDQDSNYSYVGEWVHGRKEGRGIERTPNGTYEGDFKANVRHGKGMETLKGGIVFEGKWRDNRKVGEGQRRTRWGSTETTEIQQWKEGQLMNKDESVAPDLPFLQRL